MDEVSGARESFVVVASAGHKYVANPDGLVDFVEIAEKFNDVLVGVPGEFFVGCFIDMFDVYEQKVCRFHETFDFREGLACASERDSAGIEAGVNACCFRGFEKLNHKIDLR